jgi:small multidrug resistance pump
LAGGVRPGVVALVVLAYAVSFSALALALRTINVGAAYAIWSAVGTAAVAVLGVTLFRERITWSGAAGMALIVAGVVVLVGSGSVRH